MIWWLAAGVLLAIIMAPAVIGVILFSPIWHIYWKSIIRFAVVAPLGMIAKLVTWAMALPVAALSVAMGWENLPPGLNWMQTHDNPLDHGAVQEGWRSDTWYWQTISRAKWLWRNPAYGALHRWFGIKAEGLAAGIYIHGLEERNVGVDWKYRLAYSSQGDLIMVRGKWGALYVVLGWKEYLGDEDGRHMLALGISWWRPY